MATAAVCRPSSVRGTKRSHLFDNDSDGDTDFQSPFSKKRRFTPPGLERLQAKFPTMEVAVLELALEECGGNIDAAIHRLSRLSLQDDEPASKPEPPPPQRIDSPATADQWAELLVSEMTKAVSVDDAKSRAAEVLEALAKAVEKKDSSEGLRKRVEALEKENSLLKRAVRILHGRWKDCEEKEAESRKLVKTLETENYALSVHLNLALSGSSVSGHCRPDVF